MIFGEKARAYAFEQLEKRRISAADITEYNRRVLYERLPELADYDRQLSSLGVSLAKAAAREDLQFDSIRAQIAEIDRERTGFLRAKGLTDAADYSFCQLCGDTGYVNNTLCACAKQLMREYSLAEINRSSPLELSNFGSFSLDYYSQRPDEDYGGLSPRNNMEKVLGCCRTFARNFPAGESLLMMGDAGLGKTHLALAIANDVLYRGFEVIYGSAVNIFRDMETEFFEEGRATDTLDSLKRCDLLVLDDLGAEYNNRYFVPPVVYDIINTREVTGRSTIYTTNITRQESLEVRYGEKVSSRLIGCCRLLYFFGDDIRLIQR